MPRIVLIYVRLAALLMALPAGIASASDRADYAPLPPQNVAGRESYGTSRAGYESEQAQLGELPDAATRPARPLPQRFQVVADDSEAVVPAVAQSDERAQKLGPASRPLPLAAPAADLPGGLRSSGVPPLATGAASLGIVLGLFLLVVWVVRRGMPKTASVLPREAVEVLGRAPLVGRQQVHLVRCGNKILLICLSPGGAETLTEITDPVEVDRLAGICQQTRPNSATTTFDQVLDQFNSPARPRKGLIRGAQDALDFAQLESSLNSPRELHA